MHSDIVTTYLELRQKLISEKAQVENRLQQIAQALDQADTPVRLPGGAPKLARRAVTLKTVAPLTKPKRRLSPEGRRRIIEGTKARWAKLRAQKTVTAVKAVTPAKVTLPAKAVRRRMSKAARAKMAASAKARWAKAKAAGKNKP